MMWVSTFILFGHAIEEGDLLKMQNIKEFMSHNKMVCTMGLQRKLDFQVE
jgi:hypothetical protein